MGIYDTLIDGDRSCQIKVFPDSFEVYEVGDKLPTEGTFTIVLPSYEGARFVLIEKGVFKKLTDNPDETYSPVIDKWGSGLDNIESFVNTYQELVDSLSETKIKEGK